MSLLSSGAEAGPVVEESSHMGRGRAKAKQTKVARELKYSTSGTDLDRLRAELAADSSRPVSAEEAAALAEDDLNDDGLADDEDDEDAASWSASS